jgi:hypothetical protein
MIGWKLCPLLDDFEILVKPLVNSLEVLFLEELVLCEGCFVEHLS